MCRDVLPEKMPFKVLGFWCLFAVGFFWVSFFYLLYNILYMLTISHLCFRKEIIGNIYVYWFSVIFRVVLVESWWFILTQRYFSSNVPFYLASLPACPFTTETKSFFLEATETLFFPFPFPFKYLIPLAVTYHLL